jgi:hypothetical protein
MKYAFKMASYGSIYMLSVVKTGVGLQAKIKFHFRKFVG